MFRKSTISILAWPPLLLPRWRADRLRSRHAHGPAARHDAGHGRTVTMMGQGMVGPMMGQGMGMAR